MSLEIPKIIKANCYYDKRGYLQEIYLKKNLKKNFKFSLITFSRRNVFRGFHFQSKNQQVKLIYLVKGSILDIVIDLRRRSNNFGKAYRFKLREKNILYIPKGFAHGYLSLSAENVLLYYMTNYRDAKNENGIVWNDKNLKIKFPVKKLIISKKDKKLNTFDEFLRKIKSL
jgi:dTDP-4-dehydrorhamnose 3,5-epimerase